MSSQALTPPADYAFADYFRALRQSRGLSRAGLAQRAGLAARTIAYWEAGERLPRIPELEAALGALDALVDERVQAMRLVALPRSHQQARVILAQSASPAGAEWAGVGDLLRAMRMRAGMTQAQAAAQMGVSRKAFVKWEAGENAPTPENLTRLCALLHASDPERRALQSGRLSAPLSGADASFDACEEAVTRFRRATSTFDTPLIDLQALALKQHLQMRCQRSPDALALLAQVETAHSLWLNYQERYAESRACLNRVLHTMKDTPLPQRVCDPALNLAGWYAAEKAQSYRGSARVLRQWQPSLPDGYLLLTRCCDTALYAARYDEREAARRYLRDAETCLSGMTRQRAEAERYLEITQMRVHLFLNADPQALEWLLKYATVSCNTSAHLLDWVKALRKKGENEAALKALAAADAQMVRSLPPHVQRIYAKYDMLLRSS